MPEPLKFLYTEQLINALSTQLEKHYSAFDSEGFKFFIFDNNWEKKELKQRMAHISESFHQFIPCDYSETLKVLTNISSNFNGFEYMFFPGFVELYGLNNYEDSIAALEHFTEYASSEFAVRPFIKKYNHRMMEQMELWTQSTNHHVRRLASEGCRPRLPWAMALSEFKKDPGPIIPILNKLKNDSTEYVRRSVANNLNDISKDHPDIVINIARSWYGESIEVNRIVKHGCRTLLKQGTPEIMALFGFKKPLHIKVKQFQIQETVNIGESLTFSFLLNSDKQKLGKLRIEYAIDFMKKNGSHSRKLFKISESENSNKEKIINKQHSFKIISTRKYYVGVHGLAIICNGHELAYKEFKLNDIPNRKKLVRA